MASLTSLLERCAYPHSRITLDNVFSMGMRLKHSCQISTSEIPGEVGVDGSNLEKINYINVSGISKLLFKFTTIFSYDTHYCFNSKRKSSFSVGPLFA